MPQLKGAKNILIRRIKEPESAPRRWFSRVEMDELTQSVAKNGVIQPILVCRCKGGYTLIAGQRRLRAAQGAGFAKIPAVIVDSVDGIASLLENMFRLELNCIEQAQAISALISSGGLTQKQAAERLMLSESAISNKLKVLRLDERQREFALENGLTERHLRSIMRLPNEKWDAALWECARQRQSVAACERGVKLSLGGGTLKPVVKDVRLFFNTIEHAVDIMRTSGIEACAVRRDCEDYIEYTIKIPTRQPALR